MLSMVESSTEERHGRAEQTVNVDKREPGLVCVAKTTICGHMGHGLGKAFWMIS